MYKLKDAGKNLVHSAYEYLFLLSVHNNIDRRLPSLRYVPVLVVLQPGGYKNCLTVLKGGDNWRGLQT